MAVDTTLKSTAITNRQARPPILNNPGAGGVGNVWGVYSHIASMPAKGVGTVLRMVVVPSNAILSSLRLYSDPQTAGAFNIGLYRTDKDGGVTVLDEDLFGSAVSVATQVNGLEVLNESGNFTIDKRGMPLWQAAGLSSDPLEQFEIALTTSALVNPGLGAIGLSARYII